MFLALGTGTLLGVTAGMFHLLTHAFFKALLFLGAGSVMHAMGGVIDIRRLGGLRRRMPVTHWTFLIGCLAIAGVCPFAGFWSKDAILLAVQQRSGQGDCGRALRDALRHGACLGVLLIDFYMFRPFFLMFYGPGADSARGRRPRPRVARRDDRAAGGAGVRVGRRWGRISSGRTVCADFLAATPSLAYLPPPGGHAAAEAAEHVEHRLDEHGHHGWSASRWRPSSTWAAARRPRGWPGLMNVFGLYSLSYGKFFFDPIYTLLVVWPLLGVARLAAWFDRCVIDGLVDLCGRLPKLLGAALAAGQNGLIQFYALAMVLGLLALLGALLM